MVAESVYFQLAICFKKTHKFFSFLFSYMFFVLCSIKYIDFYEKVNQLTFVQSGFLFLWSALHNWIFHPLFWGISMLWKKH